MIATKVGEPYDAQIMARDFITLWNTTRFNDLHPEREPGKTGWIVRWVLVERPIVRNINFDGLKSIQQSEILDRFKEKKVGLSAESQYDPNKVQHARNVLQDYLAERGRQFATVEPQLHQVPPSALAIIFKVDEGPKVKVNEITFEGNNAFSHRDLLRPMANLHPYRHPGLHLFRELCSPRPSIPPSSRKIRTHLRSSIGTKAISRQGHRIRLTISSTTGGGQIPYASGLVQQAGQRRRYHTSRIEEGHLYHLNKVTLRGYELFPHQ